MTTIRCRRFPLLDASLGVFVLVVTLVVLENISDSDASLIPLIVYAPQHGFALLPAILGLVSLLQRRPGVLAINAVSLALWAQWLMGWNVPFSRLVPGPSAAPEFRVTTYNVQRGERGMAALMEVISAQKPDILCLQETQDPPPRDFKFPGDTFERALSTWNFACGGDVMTMSRFPLVSKRDWPQSAGRRILETVWQTPRGRVRVLNVHIFKSDAEKQLQDRAWTTFAVQAGANARLAARTRFEQWPALEKAIAGDQTSPQTLPLIVAGDFNAPPRGRFYRALTRGTTPRLTSAWAQGGWGTGATFPSRAPLLKIDHILVRGVRARRAWVPRARASDHLPLVADVGLETE